MDKFGCFLLVVDDSGLTFPYLLDYCFLMISRMHITLILPLAIVLTACAPAC